MVELLADAAASDIALGFLGLVATIRRHGCGDDLISLSEHHMAMILQFPSRDERKYLALSAAERAFAEHLLKMAPDYPYDRSGLPKLEPVPEPGIPSAIAATKMMSACCNFGAAG